MDVSSMTLSSSVPDARPMDRRTLTEIEVHKCKLEFVPSFCFLTHNKQSLDTNVCSKTALGKFKILHTILSPRQLSLPSRGQVYSTCVRGSWALSSVPLIVCSTMIEIWCAGCAEQGQMMSLTLMYFSQSLASTIKFALVSQCREKWGLDKQNE